MAAGVDGLFVVGEDASSVAGSPPQPTTNSIAKPTRHVRPVFITSPPSVVSLLHEFAERTACLRNSLLKLHGCHRKSGRATYLLNSRDVTVLEVITSKTRNECGLLKGHESQFPASGELSRTYLGHRFPGNGECSDALSHH